MYTTDLLSTLTKSFICLTVNTEYKYFEAVRGGFKGGITVSSLYYPETFYVAFYPQNL